MTGQTQITPPAFHAGGVTKSFGAIHALRDVTLDLPADQVTAILGENGAGKSTLVKIASGSLEADAGTIAIDGETVRLRSPLEAMRRGIFVVHQEPQLVNEMTIAENLFIHRLGERSLVRSYSRSRVTELAAETLERLGMREELPDPNRLARELSAAERQLVGIVAALTRNPRVLFLDEPNSSLTRRETDRLFAIIRRLREQGVAIALVSHRLSEVYEIADRVVILRDGRKVGDDVPAKLPVSRAIQLMAGDRLREERSAAATMEAEAAKRPAAVGHTPTLVTDRGGERREVLRLEHCSGERFRDVSLSVAAGEIVGLAGLVGSGRTEIARAVIGADPLLAGQIYLNGKKVRFNSPREALRAGLAFIAEERRTEIFYSQTVRFNITSSVLDKLSHLGFINRHAQDRLSQALASRLALKAASLAAPVTSLSGGNQQKLLMARILSVEPSAVILDEPTRGVDVGTKAEIYQILRELAHDRGLAIWFISSELEEIIQLADRVLVVRQGQIVESSAGGANAAAVVASALGERLTPVAPAAR